MRKKIRLLRDCCVRRRALRRRYFLADAGSRDAFGHVQLGGVAPTLAVMVKQELNLKYHWAVSDYLQRAARHIASGTDVEQAYAMGKAAVEFALCRQKRRDADDRARKHQSLSRGPWAKLCCPMLQTRKRRCHVTSLLRWLRHYRSGARIFCSTDSLAKTIRPIRMACLSMRVSKVLVPQKLAPWKV